MSLQLGTELDLSGFEPVMLDVLTTQRARFDAQFDDFAASDWSAATRCTEWNPQQVLIHVSGANRACVRVLRGEEGEHVAVDFNPNSSPGEYVAMRAADTP